MARFRRWRRCSRPPPRNSRHAAVGLAAPGAPASLGLPSPPTTAASPPRPPLTAAAVATTAPAASGTAALPDQRLPVATWIAVRGFRGIARDRLIRHRYMDTPGSASRSIGGVLVFLTAFAFDASARTSTASSCGCGPLPARNDESRQKINPKTCRAASLLGVRLPP